MNAHGSHWLLYCHNQKYDRSVIKTQVLIVFVIHGAINTSVVDSNGLLDLNIIFGQ